MLKVIQLDTSKFKIWLSQSKKLDFLLSLLSFDDEISINFEFLNKIDGLVDFRAVHKCLQSCYYVEKDDMKFFIKIERKKILMSFFCKLDFDIDKENIVYESMYDIEIEKQYLMNGEYFLNLRENHPQIEIEKDSISSNLMTIHNIKKGNLFYYFYQSFEYIEIQKSFYKSTISKNSLVNTTLVVKYLNKDKSIYFVTDIGVVVYFNEDKVIFFKMDL